MKEIGVDIRRVDEEMRPKAIGRRRRVQLGQIFRELLLAVAPGKVGIGLIKSSLASRYIILGRVNASDKNRTSGYSAWTCAISHCQNGKGLVCGLSTRNARTPCCTQNSTVSRNARHKAI